MEKRIDEETTTLTLGRLLLLCEFSLNPKVASGDTRWTGELWKPVLELFEMVQHERSLTIVEDRLDTSFRFV